jgi:hypothetical protein
MNLKDGMMIANHLRNKKTILKKNAGCFFLLRKKKKKL